MLASHDEGLINESCLQRIYVRFLGHVPTVPRSNILCPPRRIHMHENCTMIGSDHKVDAPHCSHWNSHSVTPCLTCHGAQPCWHWLCIINICATVAITVSLATRNFRVKLLRFEDWTFRETMATPPARFHDRSCSLKLLRRYIDRANSWRNPPQDSRAVEQSAKWRARNSKRFHSRLRQWHAYRVSIDCTLLRAHDPRRVENESWKRSRKGIVKSDYGDVNANAKWNEYQVHRIDRAQPWA